MSSYRRIQASRANGARSRGPVSIRGKQASARNSLRHGMLATTVVLEGESQERFLESLNTLIDELQPASEVQLYLVESMAVARWRKLRTWTVGKIDLEREMSRQQGSPPVRAAIAFRNLSNGGRTLDLTHRYETSFDRQYTRALNQLLALKALQPDPDPEYQSSSAGGATWAEEKGEEEEKPDTSISQNEPSPKTEHPHPPVGAGPARLSGTRPSPLVTRPSPLPPEEAA